MMIPKRLRHASDVSALISIFTYETLLAQVLEVESGEELMKINDVHIIKENKKE